MTKLTSKYLRADDVDNLHEALLFADEQGHPLKKEPLLLIEPGMRRGRCGLRWAALGHCWGHSSPTRGRFLSTSDNLLDCPKEGRWLSGLS